MDGRGAGGAGRSEATPPPPSQPAPTLSRSLMTTPRSSSIRLPSCAKGPCTSGRWRRSCRGGHGRASGVPCGVRGGGTQSHANSPRGSRRPASGSWPQPRKVISTRGGDRQVRRRRLRETQPPHTSLRGHFLPGTLSSAPSPRPPGCRPCSHPESWAVGGAWVSDRLDEKLDRRTEGWGTDRWLKG